MRTIHARIMRDAGYEPELPQARVHIGITADDELETIYFVCGTQGTDAWLYEEVELPVSCLRCPKAKPERYRELERRASEGR